MKHFITATPFLLSNTFEAIRARCWGLMLALGVEGGTSDYIPSTDVEFEAWQVNFNARVAANPTRYGLDAAYAASLLTLSQAFSAALVAATDPITKTLVTIATKNADKASLKSFIRAGVAIVQGTLAVGNTEKAELGVTIRNTTPTPIPDPTTKPVLALAPSGTRRVSMTYSDELTPLSKAKPFGALGLLVHVKVSATPVADPEADGQCFWVTKSPHDFEFNVGDAGKVAYMVGRWQTRTGKIGPVSSVSQAGIAA